MGVLEAEWFLVFHRVFSQILSYLGVIVEVPLRKPKRQKRLQIRHEEDAHHFEEQQGVVPYQDRTLGGHGGGGPSQNFKHQPRSSNTHELPCKKYIP